MKHHSIINHRTRCDGVTRRDSLRIGALCGLGLGMADWLALTARAARPNSGRARACILLWLDGGPSHLETFDLKPQAPLEVRGPFRPISTVVPGIEICELLPRTAQVTDHLALVRSVTSPLGEHGLANHYLLTGYPPSPAVSHPSYGAVLSHCRPGGAALPGYVAIPQAGSASSGFLGSSAAAFETGGDPARGDFRVRDLQFFPQVDQERLQRRRAFLNEFDRAQATFENQDLRGDEAFQQAYRLVTSPEAKQAFDLSQEPNEVRQRYGPRTFGQSCLLARRLVERGVPFVTVNYGGWDTHDSLVLRLKEGYSGAEVGVGLIPTFDLAFAALIQDLEQRGLLAETLVVAMGEFGRTPKINTQAGRDHWPRVFSVVLAGGGVPGGQVIGSSDRIGESPSDRPVTPNDLACTIYTLLGIDPHDELITPDGRPIPINQGGQVIPELL